jgi:hypothetical protein
MYNETLALIVSFIAMVLIAASYFVKDKNAYLIFQASGIVGLILSYLFMEKFFATVGLTIGLCRTLIYFAYEKKDKAAPLIVPITVSFLTLCGYCIIDLGIHKNANLWDILLLVGYVCYAFAFRIRDLKKLRFFMLIPTTLSLTYNIAVQAAFFTCLAYVFELGADILSIFKYYVFNKRSEQTNEKR